MENHRAQARRLPLNASREQIMLAEVDDALAATPAERMEAMIALLDATYELWAVRGFDRDEGLCRSPRITQQRRRGLCSDRRDDVHGDAPLSPARPRCSTVVLAPRQSGA
jgi:hypothetical protein